MHTATLNSILTIIFFATTLAPFDLNAQQTITRSTKLATNIKTGESHEYRLNLNRGESAEVVVGQRGVDVIVELRSPAGRILDVIDGPTGRTGDEIVEIIAAERGNYVLIVRPFGRGAASGDYELEVRALRGARETEQMLQTRRGSRDAATAWLRPRSTAIPPTGLIARNRRIPSLDALARSSRVIGLGEATHGSREINDLRFSVSRYLIEHHGYRVIAIEASAATLELLAPYVNGDAELTPDISRSMESEIWIGKRIRGEVYRWAREWNKRHSRDRVRVIGVDPQGSAAPLRTLRDFLERAYGDELVKRWTPVEIELAAADQQTFVFGYSGVSTTTRQFLMHIVAMFDIDAPILRSRFGDEAVESAINAARILAEFSDFNSDSSGVISHSRDWYMATRILRALREGGPSAKAVYWAHNAHVAHPVRSSWSTGSVLRQTLGCDYTALGITFGEGAFVAQIADDPQNRLAISTLPRAIDESVESMLKNVHRDGSLTTWQCIQRSSASQDLSEPEWLRKLHPMHWIGGVYDPTSVVTTSSAYRPFDILRDFDGIAFLPKVTAEDIPRQLPAVPRRTR